MSLIICMAVWNTPICFDFLIIAKYSEIIAAKDFESKCVAIAEALTLIEAYNKSDAVSVLYSGLLIQDVPRVYKLAIAKAVAKNVRDQDSWLVIKSMIIHHQIAARLSPRIVTFSFDKKKYVTDVDVLIDLVSGKSGPGKKGQHLRRVP